MASDTAYKDLDVARQFERVLYLRKLDLLRDLPSAELLLLAEFARERVFPKGAPLLRRGEPVSALHFVIAGRVELRRGDVSLGLAGPGSGVGGLGILARDDEGLEALAAVDTLSLELDAEGFFELLEDRFSVFRHVLREVSRLSIVHLLTAGVRSSRSPAQVPLLVPSRRLDLIERLQLLRRMAPFGRSSINALADLSRSLDEVRHARGARLWSEGDASGDVLLVVDGVVECSSATSGVAFEAVPGQPLGNFESLAGLPRWFDARALTPVLALQGRGEELIDAFEDNFRMGVDFLSATATGLLRQIDLMPAGGDAASDRRERLARFYGATLMR
jgi:CRP-like cAMP-binding protein